MPAADRKHAKGATTLDAFADRYLTEHAEARKKPSSVRMDRQNLKQLSEISHDHGSIIMPYRGSIIMPSNLTISR